MEILGHPKASFLCPALLFVESSRTKFGLYFQIAGKAVTVISGAGGFARVSQALQEHK